MTDRLDKKILSTLQVNGNISMSVLSDQIGLSLSACHRRVKLLESKGIIKGYSAQIDRRLLGYEVQVFVEIKLTSQNREDAAAFEQATENTPEILECHKITGEFDYLIRIAAKSPSDYEKIHRDRLSMIPAVSQMKTLLSLSTIKEYRGIHIE